MARRRQAVDAVLERREVAVGDGLEDVQADPQIVVELVAIEQADLLDGTGVQPLAGRAAVRARIGEAIVEPLVTDRGPQERLGLEQAVPVPVDEPSRGLVLRVGQAALTRNDSSDSKKTPSPPASNSWMHVTTT